MNYLASPIICSFPYPPQLPSRILPGLICMTRFKEIFDPVSKWTTIELNVSMAECILNMNIIVNT